MAVFLLIFLLLLVLLLLLSLSLLFASLVLLLLLCLYKALIKLYSIRTRNPSHEDGVKGLGVLDLGFKTTCVDLGPSSASA